MGTLPTIDHHYETFIFDSARWEGFVFRPDDILVCTSYKTGTTWTQMVCALLVHQAPEPPKPLSVMSPWLDMRTGKKEDIFTELESQTHRRIIKTHTPLDGLPYRDDVHYVFCGRDPRDVFMSMEHHLGNMDFERLAEVLAANGEKLMDPPPPPPEDINERFKNWLTVPNFEWEEDGAPFWSHFQHCATYWKFRHLPNIHFLHYADMKADLEGEMRRLAKTLGIDVAEDLWPALVEAATFKSMKSNAENTAPDANNKTWLSTSNFFHKGTSDQWVDALSDASKSFYSEVTRERYDAEMLDWLEKGSKATARPGN